MQNHHIPTAMMIPVTTRANELASCVVLLPLPVIVVLEELSCAVIFNLIDVCSWHMGMVIIICVVNTLISSANTVV